MNTSRISLGFIACLAVFHFTPALALDEDRWFQVELLVFSNERVNSTEQWEATPLLAYPGAARFLVEPQRVEANLAQYHAESMVDEFGRQILTMLPEPEPGLDAPTPDIPKPEPDTSPTVTGPDITADESASVVLRPTPFVALPAEQREFRGKAAYMQRSGRYQTLFHQTWVQPVSDEARALPLVLDRSGDTGQWPRLQGSVKLYLSRYLHLQTNLWLNTPGDYLPGLWSMPAPPLGPPSLVIEALPVALETPPEQWSVEQETVLTEDLLDPNGPPTQDEEETGPVYPYRHAVLLQQKRRMRSTEVHYLDHPLFGLVVKLTPLSDEDLTSLALAEAALAPAEKAEPTPQSQ